MELAVIPAAADLLAGIRDRQAAALEQLVALYDAELIRVAYIVAGDRALAEDAAQATWLKLWERPPELRDPEALRGWLFKVAANESRSVARRRRRGSTLEMGLGANTSESAPDPATLDLKRVLAGLNPDERRLLALRYIADLTSDEIGSILGLTAEGVRSRLHRLQARMRKELQHD